ncbi:MAG: hypothetical protein GXY44_02220 [Phycisphaerales bacterium]|nr:hypothetical protein [Phycisphaerales bacterium]
MQTRIEDDCQGLKMKVRKKLKLKSYVNRYFRYLQKISERYYVMKKTLTEILNAGGRDLLARAWDKTEAAEDYAPLPGDLYNVEIVSGELTNARSGKPCYRITFKVVAGEYAGRQIWHNLWLT